jgi:hypothetical protein
MNFLNFFALLFCLNVLISKIDGACLRSTSYKMTTELDLCQENYGRRFSENLDIIVLNRSNITLVDGHTIQCCLNCMKFTGCQSYIVEFENENDAICQLQKFPLSSDSTFVRDLLLGQYYMKNLKDNNFVIGYTNDFLNI